jgi:hypothetical protein
MIARAFDQGPDCVEAAFSKSMPRATISEDITSTDSPDKSGHVSSEGYCDRVRVIYRQRHTAAVSATKCRSDLPSQQAGRMLIPGRSQGWPGISAEGESC